MADENNPLDNVVEISRKMIKSFFGGNPEPYHDLLTPNTVYVTGGVVVHGRDAIIRHLSRTASVANIVDDAYTCMPLGKEVTIVLAEITAKRTPGTIAKMQYTLVYNIEDGGIKLAYQHNSFSLVSGNIDTKKTIPTVGGPLYTLIYSLLFDRPKNKTPKIIFHGNNEEISVDPLAITYICGAAKHVEVVTINRVFTTDMTLKEVMGILPPAFCQIHRSYIVNTNYISKIRRCEAELVTGEKLPIPAASYTKVRQNLIDIIEGYEK